MMNIFNPTVFIFLLICIATKLEAQHLKKYTTPKLYLESYMGHDLLHPSNQLRSSFIFNHKRLNEIGLNAGILGFDYDYRRIKASLSAVQGTYSLYNMAEEPAALASVYEAHFSYQLLRDHELWINVGIMPSNLGFESVLAQKNRMMTRSMLAENSPYYLNAAKLHYTSGNQKWYFEALLSNGWQKMIDGYLSAGHTIQFRPNTHWVINSSSFIGQVEISPLSNSADLRHRRFFHNFFVQYERAAFNLTGGFDFGYDQLMAEPDNGGSWLAGILEFSYQWNEKLHTSVRGEYFFDPNQYVVYNSSNDEFENLGLALNFGYHLHEYILWHIEGRAFQSMNPFYGGALASDKQSLYVGTSLTLHLWPD